MLSGRAPAPLASRAIVGPLLSPLPPIGCWLRHCWLVCPRALRCSPRGQCALVLSWRLCRPSR